MSSAPFFGRVTAGLIAFACLVVLLLGPMAAYRIWAGIPLAGTGPSWEIWLLVIGGGIGAGLARFMHYYVLTKWFNVGVGAESKAWRRR